MLQISSQLSGIIEGREKVPLTRVELFDTAFTVPSSGFYVRYFSGVDQLNPTAVKRTQFEPMLMKDWSNGLPVELSQYIGAQITQSGLVISDPFSVSFSGYFYADSPGLYNFATRSTGGTEVFINNRQVLSGYQLITPTLTGYSSGYWPNKNLYWDGYTPLATGWHDITVKFYWFSSSGVNSVIADKPFVTAFYTKPSGVQKLLSASTVNIYKEFITPVNLTNVIYTSEQVDENQSSQFVFEVSVPYSGIYTWSRQKEDFGQLKINRLVKIYNGYVTESGYYQTNGYTTNLAACSDFVPKFQGFIDTITFDQSSTSVTATVKCRDFFKKTINSINENYPNNANYLPNVVNSLDRFGVGNIDRLMPNAYDNWSVFDTIEILALNAGIDPEKINKSKWDTQNYFKLESNLNWPTTSTFDINGIETKNGDPFIFKFEYGEKLFDEIKKVGDLIGYRSFFDEYGDLVLLDPRRTNRVEIYETGNYASKSVSYSSVAAGGDWRISVDINASNRFYASPIKTNGSFSSGIASISFSGVGFGLYQFNHTSGNVYRVDIYESSSLVYSNYYTNSGNNKYGVRQEITRDLPYGGYNAFIYPSGDLRIEGFEYYTQNIYKPVYTFKEDRDITNLSIDLSDDILRNEVIAVGQQTGDKAYLYSKAIDLDSISNPDSFNYVGQKKTFVLIEPTIQSQRRLDWLSQNILDKFRRKHRNISITTQGIPHLQIGDPVGINSSFANLNSDSNISWNADNNDVFYINALSSRIEQGKYTSTFSLTSLKPIESWRPPTPITNDMLERIYAANDSTIFANFKQITLNTPSGYGYDGFSEQGAFLGFDLLVDVDRLWVLVSDESNGGELFKYIDTKSKSPIITYQVSHNQDPNQPPQGAVWLHNGGGEKWGNMVVPTAQNNFNGGQWAGQNSNQNVRSNGKYPLAIWAQFKTADNTNMFQGLWVPLSGTLDNRNRTLANTTTSSGNIYYQYTSGPNNQSLVSIIGPGVSTAYLPAFVINNSDFLVDAWIGPIESGYQIISQNNLAVLSGFDYFNNNYSHMEPDIGPQDPAITNLLTPTFFGYQSPFGSSPYTGQAGSGPFLSGTKVVREGSPFSPQAQSFEYPSKGFATRTSALRYLDAYSWAFQGLNMINKPAYIYPNFSYQYSIGRTSGFESIFHEFNPITIKANHDFYLNIETVAFERYYKTNQQGCYTCLENFTEKPIWTSTSSPATRGPISVYPTDRTLNSAGAMQLFLPELFSNWPAYIKYKGAYNVMYPSYRNTGSVISYYNDETLVLTRYLFTEAKSNRKFYFIVKWDSVSPSNFYTAPNYQPIALLVGSKYTSYLRVL